MSYAGRQTRRRCVQAATAACHRVPQKKSAEEQRSFKNLLDLRRIVANAGVPHKERVQRALNKKHCRRKLGAAVSLGATPAGLVNRSVFICDSLTAIAFSLRQPSTFVGERCARVRA